MKAIFAAILALLLVAPVAARAQLSSDINGVWSGNYRCEGGVRGATDITIRRLSNFNLEAEVGWQITWPQGEATGVHVIRGDIAPDGTFNLEFDHWLNRHRNAQPIAMSGQYDSSTDTLSIGFEGNACYDLAVERRQLPMDVETAWYGTMECNGRRSQSRATEIEFTIEQRQDGLFVARMTVNYPNSIINGTVALLYLGERIGSSDEINFVLQETVRSGVGQDAPGDFVFHAETGSGQFSGGACEAISSRPMLAGSQRLSPSLIVERDESSYYAAQTERDRCEAVIAWAEQLNAAYPGRDFYRSTERGDDWRKVRLFSDDEFVRVFGTPFDFMTHGERREIAQFVEGTCFRDPFTRNRMDTYRAIATRALGDDPSNQLTSDGYSSTVFAIRTIRAARNTIDTQLGLPLVSTPTTDFAAALRTALSADFRQYDDVLWPGEIEQRREHALVLISDAYALQVNDIVGAVPPSLDGARTLHRVVSQISNLPARAISDLLGVAEASASARRDSILSAYLDADLQMLPTFPATDAGLREITAFARGQLRSSYQDFSSAPPVRSAFRQADQRIDSILTTLTERDVRQLSTFPLGKDGLQDSAQWEREFETRYQGHRDNRIIMAAHDSYLESREALLEASLPGFRAEIAALPIRDEANVDALLQAYLSRDEDRTFPVYVEYVLAANNAN